MIFPYLQITPEIKRPIIPVLCTSRNKFVFYQALIDSGADYCIFSIELAKTLEIPLTPKKKTYVRGIGKEKVWGYLGEITIHIGKKSYRTQALFAHMSEFGHGILGQQGFFDIFIVKFDLLKEEIELKERKND